MKNCLLFLIITLSSGLFAQEAWQSQILYYGSDSNLVYIPDSEGNRIPDFSYAGYKGGLEPIPDIPVVKTLSPISGDNTTRIMNALSQVYNMPIDENGFHGALLLEPGVWEITGKIVFKYSGVVLRGCGDGEDDAINTILRATGNSPAKRTVLVAGGGSTSYWRDEVSGTRTNIITDTIYVGEREFEVEDVSSYSVGDNIIIYHPCTEEWLEAIDYGGTHSGEPGAEADDVPWTVNSQPLVFNRYITAIQNNWITIDAPVFNTLIKSLSQSYIYKYRRDNLKTNIGIENLRIDIETAGGTDEEHAANAIDLYQIEDAWVRNCTMLHFSASGVRTNTASRITIENCKALDPISVLEGEKRYNFQVYTASQQILFKNCHATNGRHHYVSNGTSWTSGVVFLNCTSSGAYTSSEGHRRWSMGLLFDNHIELDGPRPGLNPRLLGLYNRGYYGTSHGWASAHSVAWNCNVAKGDLVVQKPPTAQNYAIGCFGANITGTNSPSLFDEPEGYIEGANVAGLEPQSLYLAQLEERRRKVNVNVSGNQNIFNEFKLLSNFPNPFNASTTIPFSLKVAADVKLVIYDVQGKVVKILIDEHLPAGDHLPVWNGRDNSGKISPTGIYFYVLNTGKQVCSGKMVLIK